MKSGTVLWDQIEVPLLWGTIDDLCRASLQMQTITDLRSITPKQAAMVVERLAQVNPKFLGRYFSKIRQREYVPTSTSNPDLPGMCWIWTGATDKGPRDTYCYPKIKVAGKTRRTHRWIFSVVIRPLRIDEDAHHECEVSMCVNPFHLQAAPSETHSKRGPPSNWRGDNVVPTDEEIPF